jgi:hypothetical protein
MPGSINMFLARKSVTFVAANFVPNGSGTVSMSSGQIGDLIVYLDASVNSAPGGGGWTTTSSGWYTDGAGSYSYTYGLSWKIITSTTNVAGSGGPYGSIYGIYRGATSLVTVATDRDNLGGLTFPTPASNCLGQVVITLAQNTTHPTAPSGFVERFYGANVMNLELMDRLNAPASGFSTIAIGGQPAASLGFELRG